MGAGSGSAEVAVFSRRAPQAEHRSATGVTEALFVTIFVFAFIALNSHDEVSTMTAAKGLIRSLVKYAFINRNQETFTVTRICDMMDVFPEYLL